MGVAQALATLLLTSYLAVSIVSAQGEIDGGADHPCYRECDGVQMECVYNFTIENYVAMNGACGNCPDTPEDCFNDECVAAGGVGRTVVAINRRIPGPSVQVCENDIIIANVVNDMEDQSFTIHWHGIYQRGTQFMDGVPYITQCPTLPHNTFQYRFPADYPGTHIYHGHIGYQEADGLFGQMVLRRPKANEPNGDLYDFDLAEHVIIVWHFFNSNTREVIDTGNLAGVGFLINGIGNMQDSLEGATAQMPKQVFTVESGFRYRFRVIINTAIYCPAQISVDGHTLTMIATESGAVEPVEVDSFFLNAGERADFVLTADQPVGNYWIRFRGTALCSGTQVHAEAVLRYSGADEVLPDGEPTWEEGNKFGVVYNPQSAVDPEYNATETITIAELINIDTEYDYDVSGEPDQIFYINTAIRFVDGGGYPQLNNITFQYPPVSLVTQGQELSDSDFCDLETYDQTLECADNLCKCTHVITANLNDLVEILLVDQSGTTEHPFHIHGTHYKVVAMGVVGDENSVDLIREMNENGLIEKNLVNAPLKDTISIPAQGYVALRFIADNPGFWIFHCHLSNHASAGMIMVLKIGEFDEFELFGDIPEDFPTCGNWAVSG